MTLFSSRLVAPIIGASALLGIAGCASQLMLNPGIARLAEALDPAPSFEEREQAQDVMVRNDRGALLHGLLFSSATDRGTALVSGGNTMPREQVLYYYRFLLGRGFRVLAFSFQGFDDNEGGADLGSLLGDAAAFYSDVRRRFPQDHVAYVAHSLSTSAALCLPPRVPDINGLVLDGTVDLEAIPYSKLKQLWYLFPLYPVLVPIAVAASRTVPKELRVTDCVAEYHVVPILLIHSPYDDVAPFDAALRLFDLYEGPATFIVPRQSRLRQYHMSMWADVAVQESVVAFIKRVLD
jgi:hypothetical protein